MQNLSEEELKYLDDLKAYCKPSPLHFRMGKNLISVDEEERKMLLTLKEKGVLKVINSFNYVPVDI
ncbi:MAG: hypothetical protein EB127_19670 [Alphaproteobacteria bacterium]|jgi:hypothetical protein|nr:hypothetical protein [Alphaproteobacteria bacterium]